MARNAMLEIEVLLTKLRDDIEASYKAKGLMASGNFAKGLKLVVSGNNAKITGFAHRLDMGITGRMQHLQCAGMNPFQQQELDLAFVQ